MVKTEHWGKRTVNWKQTTKPNRKRGRNSLSSLFFKRRKIKNWVRKSQSTTRFFLRQRVIEMKRRSIWTRLMRTSQSAKETLGKPRLQNQHSAVSLWAERAHRPLSQPQTFKMVPFITNLRKRWSRKTKRLFGTKELSTSYEKWWNTKERYLNKPAYNTIEI